MTKLFQAHQMMGATRNGETSTDSLTSENFALIALQCYHHSMKADPRNKGQKSSGSDYVLSKAVEKTLKKLLPRTMALANVLKPSLIGKSSYIDFDTGNYLSTEKYCKSPEFQKRFDKQFGISFHEFKRQLFEEIRKTSLYEQLRFKEIHSGPVLQPTKKNP